MRKTLCGSIACLLFAGGFGHGEEDPEEVFEEKLLKIREEYRVAIARELEKAERVELYLVSFGKLEPDDTGNPFGEVNNTPKIRVSPYGKTTEILKSRVLKPEEMAPILKVLAAQIQKKEHSGGASCHFPIHGIRVWRNEKLILESTFC